MSTPPEQSESTPQRAPNAPSQVNRVVFFGSASLILAFALWAIIWPGAAENVIWAAVEWVSATFGWYYILTATTVVIFVIVVASGKTGRVRLGPDHSRPQFSMFTWTSMLFAAGIGIDLMFFSVAEPVTQYLAPPEGEGGTSEAARQAVVWTLFHYGITGWAMYALMGLAFGLFAYRYQLPLSIRAALYPIFGKRIKGATGDVIEIAAVIGTIFGIATSLGIGVVQLNYGLHLMFGIPNGVAAQIALIVIAVVMATFSTVSGVEKGIRRLSELNVILAIVLMVYILVTGKTRFLLDGLILNLGDFASRFPGMTMNTFAFDPVDEWMSGWTLFFWAWWIAWAPFVGLFLARISRGRTVRQFVVGTMTVPFLFIAVWISIFGNSALAIVIDGNTAFGEVAMNAPEQAFYGLLEQYPAAPLVIAVATLVGLLFYVTSADSGALVMANFTSEATDATGDGPKWLRIFWAVATGALTMAMLLVGGVPALQYATVIIGLPFSLVLYLIMISVYRALRKERLNALSYQAAMPGVLSSRASPERSGSGGWRSRLARAVSYPGESQITKFFTESVLPAFAAVQDELEKRGVAAELAKTTAEGTDCPSITLTVRFEEGDDFTYQAHPVAYPVPSFALNHLTPSRSYYRVEIFTPSGSGGYDVMGYTGEQLITDLLDHYERHLEFLQMAERDGQPTLTDTGDRGDLAASWREDFEQPNG